MELNPEARMFFEDRIDAGKRLADALIEYKDEPVIVLGIPRGGVVVADEVSKKLQKPLDVIIPRKLGAPSNPELAIGAIAGNNGVILNQNLIVQLNVTDDYIQEEIRNQRSEIKRREKLYRGAEKDVSLKDRVVVVVDDGLATGFTARAAILSLKSESVAKIILAVPVAPQDTITIIGREVDKLVCLNVPEMFFAIGQFYTDFQQVSDAEVIQLLYEARKRTPLL